MTGRHSIDNLRDLKKVTQKEEGKVTVGDSPNEDYYVNVFQSKREAILEGQK